MRASRLFVLSTIFLASQAWAGPVDDDGVAWQDQEEGEQEEDDDLLGDDPFEMSEEEKKAKDEADSGRIQEADEDLLGDEEDELDAIEIDGDGSEQSESDLLEDEIGEDVIGGPGQDNAGIYQKYQQGMRQLLPDEEIIAWERYLQKYPNSLFIDRIEKRMDDLTNELYGEDLVAEQARRVDADQQDIPIEQPLQLENINPTSRVRAGFEWGLTDYMNLLADFEYGIRRDLSAHASFRNRLSGWSLEPGVKWAFVKSARMQLIVTAMLDFRMNTSPFFLGLTPQLGIGKRFVVGDRPLDIQLQAGAIIETRSNAPAHIIGGLNASYGVSETVAVFLEGTFDVKNLTSDVTNPFYWSTAGFGLKFKPINRMDIMVGTTIPYAYNYWQLHFGSIMLQVNYFLPGGPAIKPKK